MVYKAFLSVFRISQAEVVSSGAELLKVHTPYDNMRKPSILQAVPHFDKALIDLLVLVDWRKTVTSTLIRSAAVKTSSSSRVANLSPGVRGRLSTLTDKDWAQFAQEVKNIFHHSSP